MQQKLFNCQQMVKSIRDSIRKEIDESHITVHPGYIKISLVPCTREADKAVGGYSDGDEDFVNYEYTYALKPEHGFDSTRTSGYVCISIKKKTLITGKDNEGSTGRVYSWDDFLEIMVRVSGTDDRNKELANLAYKAILPFFEERLPDFAVRLT